MLGELPPESTRAVQERRVLRAHRQQTARRLNSFGSQEMILSEGCLFLQLIEAYSSLLCECMACTCIHLKKRCLHGKQVPLAG